MKTKVNFKILIALGIMLLAVFVFNMNTVNAETDINSAMQEEICAEMTIINSEGEMVVTFIPQYHAGGGSGYINTKADYSNCLFAIAVQNDYGQSFETTLGTFTYTDKYSDLEEYMSGRIYTCPVKMSNITGKKDKLDLVFSATNVDTNEKETVNAHIYIFTPKYKQNANLKVGNKNFVSEGKVIENMIYIQDSDTFAGYDEINNVLRLYNYTGKIVYSNMGSTFKIEKDENSNIEVVCEDNNSGTKPSNETVTAVDTKTDIKLEAQEGILPKNTVLEVVAIEEGTTYNTVKQALSEVKNIKVFDINILSDGAKIQPNGKVKISIPVPSDIDKSKLAVYRVADNGDKTEYAVTINEDVATFETDHFSIYVLAEKETNNSNQSGTTDASKPQETQKPQNTPHKKDDTPKTGTVDIIGYVVLATVVAGAGIVALKKRETK